MVKYKLVGGGTYYQCTQCNITMTKAQTKTHAQRCTKPPPNNDPAASPAAIEELLQNEDTEEFRRKRSIRVLTKLPQQDKLREHFIKDAQILADVFSGRFQPDPPDEPDAEENEADLPLSERKRRFLATLPLKHQNIDYFREEKQAMLEKLPEEDNDEYDSAEEEEREKEAETDTEAPPKKPRRPVGYDRLKMDPPLTIEIQRELLATKFRQREEEVAALLDGED